MMANNKNPRMHGESQRSSNNSSTNSAKENRQSYSSMIVDKMQNGYSVAANENLSYYNYVPEPRRGSAAKSNRSSVSSSNTSNSYQFEQDKITAQKVLSNYTVMPSKTGDDTHTYTGSTCETERSDYYNANNNAHHYETQKEVQSPVASTPTKRKRKVVKNDRLRSTNTTIDNHVFAKAPKAHSKNSNESNDRNSSSRTDSKGTLPPSPKGSKKSTNAWGNDDHSNTETKRNSKRSPSSAADRVQYCPEFQELLDKKEAQKQRARALAGSPLNQDHSSRGTTPTNSKFSALKELVIENLGNNTSTQQSSKSSAQNASTSAQSRDRTLSPLESNAKARDGFIPQQQTELSPVFENQTQQQQNFQNVANGILIPLQMQQQTIPMQQPVFDQNVCQPFPNPYNQIPMAMNNNINNSITFPVNNMLVNNVRPMMPLQNNLQHQQPVTIPLPEKLDLSAAKVPLDVYCPNLKSIPASTDFELTIRTWHGDKATITIKSMSQVTVAEVQQLVCKQIKKQHGKENVLYHPHELRLYVKNVELKRPNKLVDYGWLTFVKCIQVVPADLGAKGMSHTGKTEVLAPARGNSFKNNTYYSLGDNNFRNSYITNQNKILMKPRNVSTSTAASTHFNSGGYGRSNSNNYSDSYSNTGYSDSYSNIYSEGERSTNNFYSDFYSEGEHYLSFEKKVQKLADQHIRRRSNNQNEELDSLPGFMGRRNRLSGKIDAENEENVKDFHDAEQVNTSSNSSSNILPKVFTPSKRRLKKVQKGIPDSEISSSDGSEENGSDDDNASNDSGLSSNGFNEFLGNCSEFDNNSNGSESDGDDKECSFLSEKREAIKCLSLSNLLPKNDKTLVDDFEPEEQLISIPALSRSESNATIAPNVGEEDEKEKAFISIPCEQDEHLKAMEKAISSSSFSSSHDIDFMSLVDLVGENGFLDKVMLK